MQRKEGLFFNILISKCFLAVLVLEKLQGIFFLGFPLIGQSLLSLAL